MDFNEDDEIWRVSDLIAEGSSDKVYKTRYWGVVHNGFNVFKTEAEAVKARDIILKVLSKNIKDKGDHHG